MKRHSSLVPLSHDHHDALVQARRLRGAGEGSDPSTVAWAFLRFFAKEMVRHFREEEELVFPTDLDFPAVREPLVQALLEHVRFHALTKALRHALDSERPITSIMHELGELLVAHVGHEERCLFPLIERHLDDSTLAAIELVARERDAVADPPRATTSDISPEPRAHTHGPKRDTFLGQRGWVTLRRGFLGRSALAREGSSAFMTIRASCAR
jgi:iron-sulfur cluster repair protein YtfE (RIC family)